ncbi:hypothetical protein [Streptomyces catenulae]|uniref:Integral membrane protein n=1 Tax=Streptomyces catenulae TaxID=66875 RepID=A0ABV2Z6E0_9ACTN|nr:hypothetical protein [Streptomyces catenulae]
MVRTGPRTGGVDGEILREPEVRRRLRRTRQLVGWYVVLGVLTLGAAVVLRHDPVAVNGAVWTRVIIVAATSLLMASFAAGAARGHRRAFLRLRLASGAMLVAVVVIVALPGAFPVWLRWEQAGCGVLLAGVVALVNGGRLRAAFARPGNP